MLKKTLFVLAILLQIVLFSSAPVVASGPGPEPTCWPCAM